ncbi:hypothetical protein A5761_11300 [Mycolicibacterium setense]|uniref:hypothetical protein n=1 Tax=Mycolicibacterium setense TaxID=431269 RepID=UPI0007EAB443|nr:hypothetical protein [Mycolicibacterium setense]OBB17033.1 hypothetical protein A5761_11300 [Mycolicibacterium setense]
MTLPLFDLPGPTERGKRVERIEWGVRWLCDYVTTKRGQITKAPNENQARMWATHPEAPYWGFPSGYVQVVSRTVVTYTSSWEPTERLSSPTD